MRGKGLIAIGFITYCVAMWQTVESLFIPRTIKQKLVLDGYNFYEFFEGGRFYYYVKTRSENGWKSLAKTYKMANGSDLNVNITSDNPDWEEAKKFRNACRDLAQKPFKGDNQNNMEKVKKWCTIP